MLTIVVCCLVCLGSARGQSPATSYGPPAPATYYSPPAPAPAPAAYSPPAPPAALRPPAPLPVLLTRTVPLLEVVAPAPAPAERSVVDLGAAILSHVIGKVTRVLAPAAALVRAAQDLPATLARKLVTALAIPTASSAQYAYAPAPAPAAEYGPPSF